MTLNVGTIDRAVRFFVGLALIIAPLANVLGIWSSDISAYATMAVGAILIITAIVRFCPLYRIFGISSCKA